MWSHYLKVAFRNLWKYRLQNLISMIGLAIGFSCFALSLLWIRHELTYDAFHEGAERIYMVHGKSNVDIRGVSSRVAYLTGPALEERYPEIEQVCLIKRFPEKYSSGNYNFSVYEIQADSSFMSFFGVRILSGTDDFLRGNGENIAVTEELALRLWPGEEALGKEIEDRETKKRKRVCALVTGWSGHSNFSYEIIAPQIYKPEYRMIHGWNCFVKLKEGTDAEAMIKKVERESKTFSPFEDEWLLVPVTAIRYTYPENQPVVSLNYLKLFALAGSLVVLCSLLNYMALFISHLHIRVREMMLRVTCGSSMQGLSKMCMVELALLLGIAFCLGMVLIDSFLPFFLDMTGIESTRGGIYRETILSGILILLLAFFLALGPLSYFRRRILRNAMNGKVHNSGRNMFRKGCLLLQLVISFGFIFCSMVMMNQLHYLTHTDFGIARENRAAIIDVRDIDSESLVRKLSEFPMITEVLQNFSSLIPEVGGKSYYSFNEWAGKGNLPRIENSREIEATPEYMEYYGLTLLDGVLPEPREKISEIVVNEAFVRALNVQNPLGMHVRDRDEKRVYHDFKIVGIVKDFHYLSPTSEPKPVVLTFPSTAGKYSSYSVNGITFYDCNILLKFQEGTWPECKKEMEQLFESEYPGAFYDCIVNVSEVYEMYLASERTLLKLLGVFSMVCILISLFGVYSLVALSCEQRRKEIAVRKVNGASVRDIFQLFFREYMSLLGIAALISFPVSYLMMKKWLENYVNQSEVSPCFFPLILLAIAVVVWGCIGWRVWGVASRNPAEVIKSE